MTEKTHEHAQCRNEGDDLKEAPKGEEDIAKHGTVLPHCRWRLMRRCRPISLCVVRG